MSALAVLVLVLVSAWIGILSIISALLVRQVALLSKRLDPDYAMDGLPVGRRIPSWLAECLPDESGSVLVLGARCDPCRKLAHDLRDMEVALPVVAVIEGDESIGAALSQDLPSAFQVLMGQAAERAYSELSLETTPFFFSVRRREIVHKAVPRGAQHFLSLLQMPEATASNGHSIQTPEVLNAG
jgi:hypothetical protein